MQKVPGFRSTLSLEQTSQEKEDAKVVKLKVNTMHFLFNIVVDMEASNCKFSKNHQNFCKICIQRKQRKAKTFKTTYTIELSFWLADKHSNIAESDREESRQE